MHSCTMIKGQYSLPWINLIWARQLWVFFNAQDDSDNIASTNIVWIDIPQPLGDTIKINTGGGQIGEFLQDQVWGSDKEYGHLAGNFQFVTDAIDIQNTDNDDIYRSSLNRVALYKIRVKPGTYSLTLSFSENHYDNIGDRVFDIFIEGNQVVEGLDVFDNSKLSYSYSHISNNDWGETNPGTDNQQITFSKNF